MSEPVEYQMRMRPTWEATSFSDWKKCSRDAFDDYTKTPKLHEWEYEVRKLYASPPAQEIVCSTGLCHYRKPLTDEQVLDCWKQAYEPGRREHDNATRMARAIEAAHGIKGEE